MAQYLLSFLLTSLVMSAIILVILVWSALFPKMLSAKLRYAVWLVVLVGLIIPLRPVIGSGLITVHLPDTIHTQPDEITPISAPMTEINARQNVANSEASKGMDAGICLLIWGVVAASIFAYHIWRYFRFIRMIRRWGAPVKDEFILSAFRSVQAEKGLHNKKIDLMVCGFVSSSMLTGFLHPVILLPQKHFEADELELIFRHELIHYKRHDLPVKLMSVIAVSLNWFNPIVYRMCDAIQTDGEASCDEAVLQDTGIENRRFYAEVIIGMIGSKKTAGTLLSTCFYGGKSSIKRRLDSIMDTTRKIKKPAVAVLLAVMLLTVFSGSVFALAVKETPLTNNVMITAEQAKEIALAKVGGGAVTECKRDNENGRRVYEIKIVYKNTKYEMDIDAVTGVICDYEADDDDDHDD